MTSAEISAQILILEAFITKLASFYVKSRTETHDDFCGTLAKISGLTINSERIKNLIDDDWVGLQRHMVNILMAEIQTLKIFQISSTWTWHVDGTGSYHIIPASVIGSLIATLDGLHALPSIPDDPLGIVTTALQTAILKTYEQLGSKENLGTLFSQDQGGTFSLHVWSRSKPDSGVRAFVFSPCMLQ